MTVELDELMDVWTAEIEEMTNGFYGKKTSTESWIIEMSKFDGPDLRIKRTRRSLKMKVDGRDKRV